MEEDYCECEFPSDEASDSNLNYQIAQAETTLNRIIGFINNSESKTGITLTMVGVVLAIITTLGGESIMGMFSETWHSPSIAAVFIVVIFFVFLAANLIGICLLMKVLVPDLGSEGYETEGFESDSKIFFGKISSNNETYSQYEEKMLNYSSEDYLNDLWSQIYINSKICLRKFNNFNIGLKVTIPSIMLLLATIVIFRFFIPG